MTEEGAEECMKKVQITSADINRVDLQQLYQTAFPEEEQIPWKELMRLVDEMPLDFNIVVGIWAIPKHLSP